MRNLRKTDGRRPAYRYDPRKPWGGIRGSPCGDPDRQQRLEILHAENPWWPGPVTVSEAELADCRECGYCGGCLTHEACLTDWRHIVWFGQFASPGEPACKAEGVVAGQAGFTCDLPLGHGGPLHMDTLGYGWGAVAAQSRT